MSATQSIRVLRASSAWPILKRIFTAVIVVAVAALLFNAARKLDWLEVLNAAREIDATTIAFSMGLVCAGYLAYASFDILARRYAGHKLSTWRVVWVAVISYAMNLNLGVLVGGVGIRVRLYRKMHIRRSAIARVIIFSTTTNWIGYCWLAGILFISRAVPIPPGWDIGIRLLQFVGVIMLAAAVGYLGFCGLSRKRKWVVKGHHVTLPSASLAIAQTIFSAASWLIMGGIIYTLLQGDVAYFEVLGLLLFCSIAALIAHIPGGLGVTEAIFVASLSSQLPGHQVLAAILMYRVLYSIVPLCVALIAYLAVETRFSRGNR